MSRGCILRLLRLSRFDIHALDPEFAQTLAERNERRRAVIGVLIDRLNTGGAARVPKASDVVDLLFGLTSFAMYQSLAANRPQRTVCKLLKAACTAILDSMAFKSGRSLAASPRVTSKK
jgi:hypothetical protein